MSLYLDLQTKLRDRLLEEEYFSGPPAVPIVCEETFDPKSKRDFIDEYEFRLNQTGLALMILTPRVEAGSANERVVTVSINVGEERVKNRAGGGAKKPAGEVAEAVEAQLNRYQVDSVWGPLVFQRRTMVQLSPGTLYEVIFVTRVQMAVA